MTGLRGFETGIALRKTHPGHYARCNVSHLTRLRNTTESEGSSSTRTQNQAQAAPSSQPGQGQSQPAATNSVTATAASAAPANANGLRSSDYYLQLAERLLVTTKPASTQKAKAQSQYGVPVTYFLEKLLFHRANNAPGNALAYVDNDRWLSIIALYEEEIGIQYPFLNLDELRREITEGDVRNAKDDHSRQPKPPPGAKASRIQIENIAIHVLAIISIFADARTIEIANPWVEEIYAATVARTQLDSTVNAADLCLLILATIFFFLSDREILAWRGIGVVLRLLQENSSRNAGDLSLQDGSQIATPGEMLYWCVYTLDRRWSFGTELPFAVHDSEIDRHPMLDGDSLSTSYVLSMVSYCRISSDVRKWLLEPITGSTSDMTRDFLDFRIVQWKRNLPAKLHHDTTRKYDPSRDNRGDYRICLLLHLRANQMRIIVHRTSANRLGAASLDPSTVNVLADVSHDTIRALVRLADETDIYHAQHKTFNHFLESALSSMLLVLGSISDDIARASCLQDAFDAVDLIQRLSLTSPVSQRLLERLHNIHEAMDSFRARGSRATSQMSSSLDGATSMAQSAYSPDRPAGLVRLDMEQGQGNNSRVNVPLARPPEQTLSIPTLPGRGMSDRDQHQRSNLGYLEASQAMTSPPLPYPHTSSAGIPTLPSNLPQSRRAFEVPGNILSMANELPFMNFPELGQFLDENPVIFTF
ncbi:hypothetical protein TRIATDRAFT_306627 [Trichoderma atroviride IMI 206040]|uniref:Xylanolytic transcriptional activator regulatory domain-containing protein n=1 Tax=Hypocrea atroviridis (strain ATCC 20476 / IMI 206040) TaxID=452589 RepID=G9NQR7_HYPAI|nr:uncharacterized protein TRIATDRAFT_306627 [Trichoderma atroviride IMI 206040]EHK46888.1 hypothetical protein TRIATDRAFT_306627 [Trichoderma atroviride IMI 206040]